MNEQEKNVAKKSLAKKQDKYFADNRGQIWQFKCVNPMTHARNFRYSGNLSSLLFGTPVFLMFLFSRAYHEENVNKETTQGTS